MPNCSKLSAARISLDSSHKHGLPKKNIKLFLHPSLYISCTCFQETLVLKDHSSWYPFDIILLPLALYHSADYSPQFLYDIIVIVCTYNLLCLRTFVYLSESCCQAFSYSSLKLLIKSFFWCFILFGVLHDITLTAHCMFSLWDWSHYKT